MLNGARMTKITLRRAWFQVHKWLGLVLAIAIILISLTGAALVWDEPLDRWLNPARFVVSGQQLRPPADYVAAARAVLSPGERIASLRLPDGDGPVVIQATKPPAPGKGRGGPPSRTSVYLDPPTSRVLDTASSASGVLRILHNLHGSLMVPGIGRQIVGWIGVAMMVSTFTGIWLWWPMMGSWTRGFRWRRQPGTDANLHHLFGFWIALPLFVLSLTGVWISFPAFFGMFDGSSAGRQPQGRPQPVASPVMTIDAVLSLAGAKQPGALHQITWPTDKKPDWIVRIGVPAREIDVSDATGATHVKPIAPETTARLMRRIHDGTGMGLLWQSVIILGGLIPAGLAITGVIMWWRARGWRARVQARARS